MTSGVRLIWVLVPALIASDGQSSFTLVQQQGPASLWLDRSVANPLSLKLSERLTILMHVQGEAPLEVELTDKVRSTDGWHLEAVGKPTTTTLKDGNVARWGQMFVATPLMPGSQPIQLPALQYSEKGGKEKAITWDPLEVKVTTRVAKVETSEARDRVGIEELPPLSEATPWWPGLLLGLPIALAVAIFMRRRLRRVRPAESRPAGSMALQELDSLVQQPTADPDELKQFYANLSEVLRRYLERRFRLPATRWTTPEFSAALTQAWPQDGEQRKTLDEILQRCDVAKFAEGTPGSEECQDLVAMARQFIVQTNQSEPEA
jgi:hypothetical protein